MIEASGCRGCCAITALTAQNPQKIIRIESNPVAQMQAEMQAVFEYYDVAAVKTGMLLDADHVDGVIRMLQRFHAGYPVVVDPVMVSSSGCVLLDGAGRDLMTRELFPLASLITPNLPEASLLLGKDFGDPVEAAAELLLRFGVPVLLKGGHQQGNKLVDILALLDGDMRFFTHPRQEWDADRAHGTGCRLAAAVAAHLARKIPMQKSVRLAIGMLQEMSE